MPALISFDFGRRGFSSRATTLPSSISTTPNARGSGTSASAITGPPTARWWATIDVGPHAAQRVSRAEPFRLLLVRDREAQPLAVSEAFPDPVALPSDQDRRLRDPGGPQRLVRMAQERLARHRQKRLGKIGREGTHPSSLAGREDDCLHAAAPFALDR